MALDEFLPYRLSVASNHVSRLFAGRYSAAFGLSIPEWRVLAMVGHAGPITAAEIGERTGMDKAKVSRAVAALVGRGLLGRTPRPEDRRAQALSFTAEGRRIYRAIIPMARMIEAEVAADLTPAEVAVLRTALARIDARARTLLGEAPPPRSGAPD